uniref:uncharacterized protein LOC127063379 isoform X1 n=1 Tax=Vespula vulgaris TaxID=7454 RepID=UPI00223C2BE9|nr:uncharacterized protein LOC127063379 isoform X1 [Vespula vulgaris]
MYQKTCEEKDILSKGINTPVIATTLPTEQMYVRGIQYKKRDASTSISAIKLPLTNETTTPDHGLRKTTIGHRREYADRPTSTPSVAVKIAAIQTNPKHASVEESQQTSKSDLKEVLVQTTSRCEFCNQQLQTQGILTTTQLSTECAPCSAIIQLLRGAVATPCCPNCNCKPEVQTRQKKRGNPNPDLNGDQKNVLKDRMVEKQIQVGEDEVQIRDHEMQTGEYEVQMTDHGVQTVDNQLQMMENVRDHSKNNESRVLTSFTKMTVTVHCASPSTKMEIVSSTGSKENIVTTYIPPHGPPVILANNEDSQNGTHVAVYQQTENSVASVLYSKNECKIGQIQEIESSNSISVAGSIELEKCNNGNEKMNPPLQIKNDKEDIKKNDIKEVRQNQILSSRIPKSDTNDNPTSKGRKMREQSNPLKQNKKLKKSGYATGLKDKKDDNRTYSRFLPLEDIKIKDPKEIKTNEQNYMQNFCMPIIPQEIIEHPHCVRTRTISSVFQRNNRIDPIFLPECDTFVATEIEKPYIQGDIDPSDELFTTLPITATTNIIMCTKCRKEMVLNITNQSEDISQENFNSGNTKNEYDEKLTYCNRCGQLQY